jgi:hypothetical protein
MKAIDLVVSKLKDETDEDFKNWCPFLYLNNTKQICYEHPYDNEEIYCEECWNQKVNDDDFNY